MKHDDEHVPQLGPDERAHLEGYRATVALEGAAAAEVWSRVMVAIEAPESAHLRSAGRRAARLRVGVFVVAGLAAAAGVAAVVGLRSLAIDETAAASRPMASSVDPVRPLEKEAVTRERNASPPRPDVLPAPSALPARPDASPVLEPARATVVDPRSPAVSSPVRGARHGSQPGGRGAHRPEAPNEAASSAPSQGVPNLVAELEAIEHVRRELAEGRPREALRSLAAHRRRFPASGLEPELAALTALATCRAQAGGRREALADFVRRYPESPLLDRVREGCAEAGAGPALLRPTARGPWPDGNPPP